MVHKIIINIMDNQFPNFPLKRKANNCIKSAEYKKFIDENHDILRHGSSQTSIRMIDALLNSNKVPFEYTKHQLRHLVLLTLKDIALNEFQVALWTILIEKYTWKETSIDIRLSLVFAGLLTKETLGENLDYLLSKYSLTYISFKEKYYNWRLSKNGHNISPIDINRQYTKLKNEKKKINYNYYVDEILLKYIPYSNSKKQQTKNKRKNKDFLELINSIDQEGRIINEKKLTLIPKLIDEELESLSTSKNFSNHNEKCSTDISNEDEDS